MKRLIILSITMGCLLFALTSCETAATTALSFALHQATKPKSDVKLLEKQIVGKTTVELYEIVRPDKKGYLFTFDRQGGLFISAYDEEGMQQYQNYLQMNSAEKKQFIRENFLKSANIDLGPTPGDTHEASSRVATKEPPPPSHTGTTERPPSSSSSSFFPTAGFR